MPLFVAISVSLERAKASLIVAVQYSHTLYRQREHGIDSTSIASTVSLRGGCAAHPMLIAPRLAERRPPYISAANLALDHQKLTSELIQQIAVFLAVQGQPA